MHRFVIRFCERRALAELLSDFRAARVRRRNRDGGGSREGVFTGLKKMQLWKWKLAA